METAWDKGLDDRLGLNQEQNGSTSPIIFALTGFSLVDTSGNSSSLVATSAHVDMAQAIRKTLSNGA